ncbi:hypothetical protein ETAA8_51630 [Anatilimnocola aggregata]|uniref:Uncharacterized protein n=1 Tax=Anatilimnocola aggregata TaxID=2528021 RepID=A0A517YIK7_9BACT|nr:hypothetical protein [Anatilimnocola aggregata]QDU30045.1 hypothetical protein ETAA8_51630 [Anatilimnocola aggregata]
MKRMLMAVVLLAVIGSLVEAAKPSSPIDQILANPAAREQAIANLRAEGPAGLAKLDELRKSITDEIVTHSAANPQQPDARLTARLAAVETLMDEVAAQRYACKSRLFWYTDLEQAQAAATKQNKPILSLRMLGKLNEDFSCANSRFFRTTLYANRDVSELLRENFVLHWKSVRPVPRVTIDFGDGRKLERTLTGNSIHYVLTSDGQIVDALPGLYGPAAFMSQLKTSLQLIEQLAGTDEATRSERLVAFHQLQLSALDQRWASDYQTATQLLNSGSSAVHLAAPSPLRAAQPLKATAAPPNAAAAAQVTRPKKMVEMPLVRAAIPGAEIPANVTDDKLWQIIASLHAAESKLDEASMELIRSQNPIAAHAVRLATTKARIEDPLVKLVRTLENSIAVDTVCNEYQFHRQIHEWLANSGRSDVEQFNERVYAQLFLTPSSDPWLGLAPIDTYTALPNAGVAANR